MTEWNRCPGCGTTISSAAAYCPGCGEPWTVKCSRCEASWRFWKLHKFCPGCGAPVEEPAKPQAVRSGRQHRKAVN
jgi:predicted amidophosphoribosyltransferase